MGRVMKVLIAGWFSYANGHATAGDLLARDLLCQWLDEEDIDHEIAVAPPFGGGRALDAIDPAEFSHIIFVCGPFGRGELEGDFLHRFPYCRLIGLNLSLRRPRQQWQPFDYLIERDSDTDTNADMVFASQQILPPLVGVCLVEPDPRVDVDQANAAIFALLSRHAAARVNIDTRLDVNDTGLRTEGEVEAVIARMDALVTTRLHGLVLALKSGVPVLAVDSAPGGGKITHQCARIGWHNVLRLEDLKDEAKLDAAWNFALSEEAKVLARSCADNARSGVLDIRRRLFEALGVDGAVERNFASRTSPAGMEEFMASLPSPPQLQVEQRRGVFTRIRSRFAQ